MEKSNKHNIYKPKLSSNKEMADDDYITIRTNLIPPELEQNNQDYDFKSYNYEKDASYDERCYLTTACMKHLKGKFDDNCYELRMLRWFRDKFVSKEDKEHYYITAPIIVEALNNIPDNEDIYEYIYQNIILKCIEDIKEMNYESAYSRYKNMVLTLEEEFARPVLEQRIINTLKPRVFILKK